MKTVDHIAVLVEDLEVSQKWYEENCAAELIFEDIPILNDHKDLTHGDDYELCFTAPCHLDDQLKSQGFFLIGKIIQKLGLSVKKGGSEITFEKNGWDPFE